MRYSVYSTGMRIGLLVLYFCMVMILVSCYGEHEHTKAAADLNPDEYFAAKQYNPKATTDSPSLAGNVVSWSRAVDYIGNTVTVCGPVIDVYQSTASKGKPTFINIGKPYPDPERFTVIIWENNRAKFSQAPENCYEGKTICVTGKIIEYNGMAEIEVKNPDQIQIHF